MDYLDPQAMREAELKKYVELFVNAHMDSIIRKRLDELLADGAGDIGQQVIIGLLKKGLEGN